MAPSGSSRDRRRSTGGLRRASELGAAYAPQAHLQRHRWRRQLQGDSVEETAMGREQSVPSQDVQQQNNTEQHNCADGYVSFAISLNTFETSGDMRGYAEVNAGWVLVAGDDAKPRAGVGADTF